jgi:Uma2 family endonuclease
MQGTRSLPLGTSGWETETSDSARLVWVVDPVREEIQVFRSPFTPRVLAADGSLHGEDVLPGFSVRVSELFEIY